jgi:glycosyltransferase involved in cell wall biosynthesis
MKISVIIPALNAGASLEQAMQSVWRQSHKDVELIVMDGGSTDGTRELLERNSHRIAYWESQKDNGTTDAINRGYRETSGELITFLCADDQFCDDQVFSQILNEFAQHPETQVLCSSIRMVDPKDIIAPYINPSDPRYLHRRGSLHLAGAFFRREVFRDRQMSEDVDVANDYELFGYLTRQQRAVLRVTNLLTVQFSLGGRTNNPKTDFWKARECFYVRRKYFGFWRPWIIFIYELLVASLRNLHIRPLTWKRKLLG